MKKIITLPQPAPAAPRLAVQKDDGTTEEFPGIATANIKYDRGFAPEVVVFPEPGKVTEALDSAARLFQAMYGTPGVVEVAEIRVRGAA